MEKARKELKSLSEYVLQLTAAAVEGNTLICMGDLLCVCVCVCSHRPAGPELIIRSRAKAVYSRHLWITFHGPQETCRTFRSHLTVCIWTASRTIIIHDKL